MTTFPRVAMALVCASWLSGCFHYTANVPGVLDLRSDGSSAAPNEAALVGPTGAEQTDAAGEEDAASPITRTGVSSLFAGDGIVEQGTQFTIEDRHWFIGLTTWAPGLFLISNPSATEELEAALGGEAVRNLHLGHTVALTDVLLTVGVGIVPVIGTCASVLVAPRPWTFTASGERIRAVRSAAVAPPVEPPAEEPPAEEPPAEEPPAEEPPAEEPPPTAESAVEAPAAEAPAAEAPAAEKGGDK